MSNATHPTRRMRFSFESRCRIVELILAGQSPRQPAGVVAVAVFDQAEQPAALHALTW
jgi:hypothetical protein